MVALRGEKVTLTRVQEHEIVSDSDSCDSIDSIDSIDSSDSSDSSKSSDSSGSGNSRKWLKIVIRKLKLKLIFVMKKHTFIVGNILLMKMWSNSKT